MVKQLIYKSRSITDISLDFVEDILMIATTFNRSRKITGLLLYNKDIFIQFLEGAPDDVSVVLNRIYNDVRHTDLTTLYTGYSDRRFYPHWSMAALPADCTLKNPISEIYIADSTHSFIELRQTNIEIESLIQSFSKAHLPETKPERYDYN